MKEQISDKELSKYFKQYKEEIEDNGFSMKVIESLPKSKRYNLIMLPFVFIGIMLCMKFVSLAGFEKILIVIRDYVYLLYNEINNYDYINIAYGLGGVLVIILLYVYYDIDEDDIFTYDI